ncbi:MAG: flippase-like domain-containing protein [Saprospiraceae bacterium]|nr:flippase-like domain-containing protein [Bacteroidia bacterium]NNE16768.1 flippase-like domain-containing protein [Saprospiraceae bacterium]NNL92317.1 flippase-like domain-containing protein [Saprospiraceae bacterium]
MSKSLANISIEKTINKLVIVVSIGIIAHLVFLLMTNDKNIFQYLSKIKLQYLFLIILLLLFNWVGHATRLVIWTRYLKQQLPFKTTFRIAVYTELGAAITPTLVGGGPIKLGLLIKNGISTGKAGFLTLLNGIEDFIMYCSVFAIGFIYARESIFKILESISNAIKTKWEIAVGIILFFILLNWSLKNISFLKKIKLVPIKYRTGWHNLKTELKKGWREMIDSFNQVRKDGLRYFIVSFIILITQWFCRFSVLAVLLFALDIAFKPFQIYIQQWMVYLTMIFVPTPGATGGAEATFFLLFEGEIPKELLPLIVSTWRFFLYYLMLFLAVFLIQFVKLSDSDTVNS